MTADTIFALSSGPPPAAIAVLRISGPHAALALSTLAGRLPAARRATVVRLNDPESGVELDRTLALWLPGPATATGEDSVELHLHGGRAVVAAVEAALQRLPHFRHAQAGEFTRRAFATELQRRSAQAMAGGALSRAADGWRTTLLGLSAGVEAVLDFSDEEEVGVMLPLHFADGCLRLRDGIAGWLARPRSEMLRDGFRVVLAGPPNAGKSTLFNALVDDEAAITAAEPGTTRDLLLRPVALDGVPFTFVDTAGLRDEGAGEVERIGIARARAATDEADLVLWLGPEGEGGGPAGAGLWEIEAQIDHPEAPRKRAPAHRVSALTGAGLSDLRAALVAHARTAMPRPGQAALNLRQHRLLAGVADALGSASEQRDGLLAAEDLRLARLGLDALVGQTGTEDMLDALFGRFCIGK